MSASIACLLTTFNRKLYTRQGMIERNSILKGNEAMAKKNSRKSKQQPKKRSHARIMNWTLVVILVVCVGAILYKAASGPQAGTAVDEAIFQYERQPALGSGDAPIKIVEFADFKCPTCKLFGEQVFPHLKKEFIDSGQVQFYFLNYPVVSPNGDSGLAALAAEAAYEQDPDEFWKFYEALFAEPLVDDNVWTAETLAAIAEKANARFDYDRLKEDIERASFAAAVREDLSIGDQAGVTGTPTVYINGKPLTIDQTLHYEALRQAILEELEETS